MGLMDNVNNKAKDMMNDPDKKQQIEQMAKDKGISIEQAKEKFMKKNSSE